MNKLLPKAAPTSARLVPEVWDVHATPFPTARKSPPQRAMALRRLVVGEVRRAHCTALVERKINPPAPTARNWFSAKAIPNSSLETPEATACHTLPFVESRIVPAPP